MNLLDFFVCSTFPTSSPPLSLPLPATRPIA